jgi:hypothetical protein
MNDITLCNQCRRVIKGQIFLHMRRTMCSMKCVDAFEVERDRQSGPPPMQYQPTSKRTGIAAIV